MNSHIKAQSLKKNFIFQILYQVVMLVIPLIITPYLTRRLGADAYGVYTYTYSIAYYFVIFAMLGIMRHGQRLIVSKRNDENQLRKAFWSLYFVHVCFSLLALAAYVIFIYCIGEPQYRTVYLFQTIYVASALFDITWLFYGLENFQSVVIKNFLVKALECILIFTFVKSPDDLWLYTLIMSGSIFLGQAVMVPQAMRAIPPIGFGWADIKQHFKPLFVLLIAVVAATLYTIFDKTLLGIMSTKANVAYYECSNKITNVPRMIIGAIGTVMLPRACDCVARGDEESAKKYMDFSLHLTCMLGIGSVFGLLGVANLLAVLYFGSDFAICGEVIMAISPTIFIIELGDILRTQYMVPNGMDKQLSLSLVLNAILNLILTVILIPPLGIYGAVIGTLAAETLGLVFQLVLCRNFLSLKKILVTMLPYVIFSGIMYGLIYLVRMYYNRSIADLLLQILIGGGIYLILSAVYLFFFSSIRQNLQASARKLFGRKKPSPVTESGPEQGSGCEVAPIEDSAEGGQTETADTQKQDYAEDAAPDAKVSNADCESGYAGSDGEDG